MPRPPNPRAQQRHHGSLGFVHLRPYCSIDGLYGRRIADYFNGTTVSEDQETQNLRRFSLLSNPKSLYLCVTTDSCPVHVITLCLRQPIIMGGRNSTSFTVGCSVLNFSLSSCHLTAFATPDLYTQMLFHRFCPFPLLRLKESAA